MQQMNAVPAVTPAAMMPGHELAMGSREIADVLAMSVRTVETHRLRVRRKLRLESDEGLTGYVQRYPEIMLPG